ncbi:MAG: hypothetical protein U1C47_23590, partial [Hydrogenophaga sp.]|nr:hypothetical protein [Hydrogenophaga sp.]
MRCRPEPAAPLTTPAAFGRLFAAPRYDPRQLTPSMPIQALHPTATDWGIVAVFATVYLGMF